jgi:hypothetical protein
VSSTFRFSFQIGTKNYQIVIGTKNYKIGEFNVSQKTRTVNEEVQTKRDKYGIYSKWRYYITNTTIQQTVATSPRRQIHRNHIQSVLLKNPPKRLVGKSELEYPHTPCTAARRAIFWGI